MRIFVYTFLLLIPVFSFSQDLYFPPLTGVEWETISPEELNWCPERIDSLVQFLDDKNTRAFIVLKDGKIVLEEYFDNFTQDSVWYWASAGKSLTAFLTGMAEEMNLLNINDLTSDYLGTGWSSTTSTQQSQITIRNQLTMTTGLDDGVDDVHCTDPECLQFLENAGNRWAYHNAPYTLLTNVLEEASGLTINQFVNNQMTSRIGMTGLYFPLNYQRVFFSKPRSMARFGLLMLNNGTWENDTLISDLGFLNAMTNTSQEFNQSYGYLWWLNGKGSYMLPTLQIIFETNLIPNAPEDMYAALGKNDQKIYVVPSHNMVVIRMGNSAGQPLFALSSFDNALWEKINELECESTVVSGLDQNLAWSLYPNPVNDLLSIETETEFQNIEISIFDLNGKLMKQQAGTTLIQTEELPASVYVLKIKTEWGSEVLRFVKR